MLSGAYIDMKSSNIFAAFVIGVAVLSSGAFANAPEGWETDVKTALEKAKKEKKAVMLSFVGSDWCPPCIEISKNVYSKDEFVKLASENYVLVHLDFPNGNQELLEKNIPYAKHFKIQGFPSVILLDSEGVEFNRFIAVQYPEVGSFLGHLEQALENKVLD